MSEAELAKNARVSVELATSYGGSEDYPIILQTGGDHRSLSCEEAKALAALLLAKVKTIQEEEK